MALLIRNGRLLDPANKTDKVCSLFVDNGKVKAILDTDEEVDKVRQEMMAKSPVCDIDAEGCFVMPGLIDLHVHLREPGFEYKETVETGCAAAMQGGFTTICPMPNTKPVTDSPERIAWLVKKAKEVSKIHVIPVGAVTRGQAGEEVTDIEGMVKAGAGAISEDGKSVMNSALYRQAMKEAARLGIPVLAHCEDKNLVEGGVLNLGDKSKFFGVKGISNAVEDIIVARDILLAKETGCKLHLCHCSTRDSVKMVKEAKAELLKVTAEVCPHHFTLSTDQIRTEDSNYKMNPPLRASADVRALREGLRTDIMDCIATDHAPHSAEEKARDFNHAPFGIVGSETAVCLTVTELLERGYLTPMQMAEKMSYHPAKVLGIDKGNLGVGKTADITIIDPKEEYVIDADTFASKGKNTPFHGKRVRGKVKYTIVDGEIVYLG